MTIHVADPVNVVEKHTAVEHFLLLVPQRGTVFLSHSETRKSAMPASDDI